ncbi:MAG: DUF262 domain-containing protein [Actinomycetota bacterium]|nr:DUF262 domain-containing protein [Actinomycetota bacterium]
MARNRTAKELVSACEYSVHDLFRDDTFFLDYFQREYVWEQPQVDKLLADLTGRFLDQFSDEHSAHDVAEYDPYFLGPFIVYQADKKTYLADGQQRVVTLLLLLIFLRRLTIGIAGAEEKTSLLSTLILSERFGRRTYTVDVDEYASCFEALYRDRRFAAGDAPLNVQRVWTAFQHVENHFPATLRGEALLLFIDWLLHRVSLVAMNAGDRRRAVEMYQTINDRGVHLSPMDHLKRYLLSDAESDPRALEGKWNAMVSDLEKVERGAAFAYVRTVFRAKFPAAARAPGPSLTDATHEWVLAHETDIWATRKHGHRAQFFTDTLYPLHHTYATLLRARNRLNPALAAVRFNAHNGISEQFDLTVAALRADDSQTLRESKAALVANFLDLFYVTQMVEDEPVEQKSIDELVSEVITAVRLSETDDELRRVLGEQAAGWPDRLDRLSDLRYDRGKHFVHYVLTRLTAWVETGAGRKDPTEEFLTRRTGERGFEIEHLFTSTASEYEQMVPDASYYAYLRNRIGALLLLDGLDNGSYGGMRLEDKLKHYRKDTLLGGMLNPDFLDRGNVKLRRFLRTEGLDKLVVPYKTDEVLETFIEARGRLYREIAKRIWNLGRLGLIPPADGKPAPAQKRIRLVNLLDEGLLLADDRLVGVHRKKPYYARVLADGRIETASGTVRAAPTAAMMDAVGTASNGWAFWRVDRTSELLDTIRKRYFERVGRRGP